MSKSEQRKTTGGQTRAHHDRMRARGMKLVHVWVPDTKSPEFAAEAARQSRMIAESPQEPDDQAFVDSISEMKFE